MDAMLLAFAARSRPTKSASPRPGFVPWLLRSLLVLLLVGAVLGGLIGLGRLGLGQLRQRDRYLVPLVDIDCDSPPGVDRTDFLDQVQYYGHLPARLPLLDERLPQQLESAFGQHPWVEKVSEVKLEPPRHIRVGLVFRRPVLVVFFEGEPRAVDAAGVLLPRTAPTRRLPVYDGIPHAPRGEGKRWGDPDVEEAARKTRRG